MWFSFGGKRQNKLKVDAVNQLNYIKLQILVKMETMLLHLCFPEFGWAKFSLILIFQTKHKDQCGWCLTAVEVYQEDPFQVLVVNQGRMDTWAWLMVDSEVAPVRVSAKQVELLFIYNEFLKGEKSHEAKVLRGTGWNLLRTVCNVSVPLSHNLTVLLATEKLKSQDWCCSRTVWSSAAMNQPSVQHNWSRADTLVSGALLHMHVWNHS